MSIYIDADAFVRWEKGEFDLPGWLLANAPDDEAMFPATVWQQVNFGVHAWIKGRAEKRNAFLTSIGKIAGVVPFTKEHAERAARLGFEISEKSIGFGDLQIAATALVDDAELLTFNREHFGRVPGLRIANPSVFGSEETER